MPRRVLVVDDEMQIRDPARYLAAEGFLVQEAATGAQALHLLATEPADLVLLDIGLPDIDGLEVLRTLRKTSDVYVVLVTARAEEIDTILGLGVGADDYVTKPFSPGRSSPGSRPCCAGPVRMIRPAQRQGPWRPERERLVDRPPTRTSCSSTGSASTSPGVRRGWAAYRLCSPHWSSTCSSRSPARRGGVLTRPAAGEGLGYDFFGDERVVDVHIRGCARPSATTRPRH